MSKTDFIEITHVSVQLVNKNNDKICSCKICTLNATKGNLVVCVFICAFFAWLCVRLSLRLFIYGYVYIRMCVYIGNCVLPIVACLWLPLVGSLMFHCCLILRAEDTEPEIRAVCRLISEWLHKTIYTHIYRMLLRNETIDNELQVNRWLFGFAWCLCQNWMDENMVLATMFTFTTYMCVRL